MNSKTTGYILTTKEKAIKIFNHCNFLFEEKNGLLLLVANNEYLSEITFIKTDTLDNLGNKEVKVNILDMQTQGMNVLLEIEVLYHNYYNEYKGQTISTTFTTMDCWKNEFNQPLIISLEDDTSQFKISKKLVLKNKYTRKVISSNICGSTDLLNKIIELRKVNQFLSFQNVRLEKMEEDIVRKGIINVTILFDVI